MRIAIDFDGVIHDFRAGFTTASDTQGGVVPGAREFVTGAIAAGHKVCIFSGRSCGPSSDNAELPPDDGGKKAIEDFLVAHNFPALSVHCRKPHADLFIDDLGYRFEGEFPAVEDLASIATPWYKRDELSWYRGNAMSGLATGNRRGKSKERAQDILTPQSILDFVETLWPEGISMDPCATQDPRNLVRATVKVFAPDSDAMSKDGLTATWHDRTYVNPPYKQLKAWLDKACKSAAQDLSKRFVVLCPVRPHRSWWRAARDCADAYVELNPVAFVGYAEKFPAPLCLMIWGSERSDVDVALLVRPIGARVR